MVDLDRTDTGAMLAAVQRGAAAGRGRGHGTAGPGLRLDGHVRQLQQARRRVRATAVARTCAGGRGTAWRPGRCQAGRRAGRLVARSGRRDGTAQAARRRRSRCRPSRPRRAAGRRRPAGAPRPAPREPRPGTAPPRARVRGLGPAADRVLPDPRRQPADHRARPGDGLLGLHDQGAAAVAARLRTSSASSSSPPRSAPCCCWSPPGCR